MTQYIPATLPLLEKQWDKTITTHPGDIRWVKWKDEYISYNKTGMAITFLVVIAGGRNYADYITPVSGSERQAHAV